MSDPTTFWRQHSWLAPVTLILPFENHLLVGPSVNSPYTQLDPVDILPWTIERWETKKRLKAQYDETMAAHKRKMQERLLHGSATTYSNLNLDIKL